MQKKTLSLLLFNANGLEERWTIEIKPLPKVNGKTIYAWTDWDNRVLEINSKTKPDSSTLVHEAAHIAGGQNISEEFVINLEANFNRLMKHLPEFKTNG